MAPILELIPTLGFSEAIEPKVNVVSFSDGYEQRSPDGINNIRSTWQIVVNGMSDLKAAELEAQLNEWRGVTEFLWDNKGAIPTRLYVCSKWSFVFVGYNANNFTAEFREVF